MCKNYKMSYNIDISTSSSDTNKSGSICSFDNLSTQGFQGSSEERIFSDNDSDEIASSVITQSEKSDSPDLTWQKVVSDNNDQERETLISELPSTSKKFATLENENNWELLSTDSLQQYRFDYPELTDDSDSDYELREEIRKRLQKERLEKEKQREQYFKDLQIPMEDYPGLTIKELSHNRVNLQFKLQEMADDTELVDDYKYRIVLKPDHNFKWYIDYCSVPPEARVRQKFIKETIDDEDIPECIDYFYKRICRFIEIIIKDKMDLMSLEEAGILD